ncbi:MAG: ABATE domain-containing protein [Kiloniellales bacterium]
MNSNPTPLPPRPARPVAELRPIAGHLCLDFVNTLGWRGDDRPNERLARYGDLVTWCLGAGTLTPKGAKALRGRAAADPAAAEAVLVRARDLREALHRLFAGDDSAKRPDDLPAVNAELARAPARQRLGRQNGGFAWPGEAGEADLDRVLWPIVWSGVDLLVDLPARSGRGRAVGRVKACADATCGALFDDASRNRARRWCVMEDCGNRAKARRHYARRKVQEAKIQGRPATARKSPGKRPAG